MRAGQFRMPVNTKQLIKKNDMRESKNKVENQLEQLSSCSPVNLLGIPSTLVVNNPETRTIAAKIPPVSCWMVHIADGQVKRRGLRSRSAIYRKALQPAPDRESNILFTVYGISSPSLMLLLNRPETSL